MTGCLSQTRQQGLTSDPLPISREELVVLRQKVIDVSPCLLPLLPDAEIHEMEGKVQNN